MYCSCRLFAADTIIYVNGKDCSEIEQQLTYDLNNIVKWLDNNSKRLNTSINIKTKFMLIHDPRKLSMIGRCNIEIDGVHLKEVNMN